ncbi:MAG: methyltransferase domain-containing protein [Anaerolineae bacterium]
MSDNLNSDAQSDVPDLIRQSWAKGSATDWFEQLYASAAEGKGRVPWAQMTPYADLVHWLDAQQIDGAGQTALVVGCGLGDDAEELARRGFNVTAFDVSETAVQWAKERFPETPVRYEVADLLNPPEAWTHHFNFVLESRTIQALPYQLYQDAVARIAGFAAPGGRVLVLCHARNPEEHTRGIPWPLSTRELAAFTENGLTEVALEDYYSNGLRRFRVEYQRPADQTGSDH